METFKTEVHVPPGSKVEFELHYQEMLQRKLGFYTHTLHIQPGRLVPLLQVSFTHMWHKHGHKHGHKQACASLIRTL